MMAASVALLPCRAMHVPQCVPLPSGADAALMQLQAMRAPKAGNAGATATSQHYQHAGHSRQARHVAPARVALLDCYDSFKLLSTDDEEGQVGQGGDRQGGTCQSGTRQGGTARQLRHRQASQLRGRGWPGRPA